MKIEKFSFLHRFPQKKKFFFLLSSPYPNNKKKTKQSGNMNEEVYNAKKKNIQCYAFHLQTFKKNS